MNFGVAIDKPSEHTHACAFVRHSAFGVVSITSCSCGLIAALDRHDADFFWAMRLAIFTARNYLEVFARPKVVCTVETLEEFARRIIREDSWRVTYKTDFITLTVYADLKTHAVTTSWTSGVYVEVGASAATLQVLADITRFGVDLERWLDANLRP
jgi:hypothetical protein